MLGYINGALKELSAAARKKYVLALIVQALLPLLDLIGIGLVGILSYLLQGKELPKGLHFLSVFPSANSDTALIQMLFLIITFFSLKGILAPLLLKRATRFLANEAALISVAKTRQYFEGSRNNSEMKSLSEDFYRLGLGVFISIYDTLTYALIIFSEMVMIIVLIMALIYVQVSLSVFLILYFGAAFMGIHRWVSVKLEGAWKNQIYSNLESEKRFLDIQGLAREIRIYNLLDRFLEDYSVFRRNQASSRTEIIYFGMLPKYLYDIVFFFGIALVVTLQKIFIQDSSITTLVLFVAVGSRILPSLVRVQTSFGTIKSAASANRNWKINSVVSEELED
jgi:hypothetical protein